MRQTIRRTCAIPFGGMISVDLHSMGSLAFAIMWKDGRFNESYRPAREYVSIWYHSRPFSLEILFPIRKGEKYDGRDATTKF